MSTALAPSNSITLRPYQAQAVEAVYRHLRQREDNPCVVIPTAGGKTPNMATICRDAVQQWDGRVLILAHVKELLELPEDSNQEPRGYEAVKEAARARNAELSAIGRDAGVPDAWKALERESRSTCFPACLGGLKIMPGRPSMSMIFQD